MYEREETDTSGCGPDEKQYERTMYEVGLRRGLNPTEARRTAAMQRLEQAQLREMERAERRRRLKEARRLAEEGDRIE